VFVCLFVYFFVCLFISLFVCAPLARSQMHIFIYFQMSKSSVWGSLAPIMLVFKNPERFLMFTFRFNLICQPRRAEEKRFLSNSKTFRGQRGFLSFFKIRSPPPSLLGWKINRFSLLFHKLRIFFFLIPESRDIWCFCSGLRGRC